MESDVKLPDSFRYQVVDSRNRRRGEVIVEFAKGADGEQTIDFFEMEDWEVCWYQREPEDVEREEVIRLLRDQQSLPLLSCPLIDIQKLRSAQVLQHAAPILVSATFSITDCAIGFAT